MDILSQRIIAKVSGPAWEQLRGQFLQIARLLLAVFPDANSELITTYVKFTINSDPQSPHLCGDLAEKQQAIDRRPGLARGLRGRGTWPRAARDHVQGPDKVFRGGARRRSAQSLC